MDNGTKEGINMINTDSKKQILTKIRNTVKKEIRNRNLIVFDPNFNSILFLRSQIDFELFYQVSIIRRDKPKKGESNYVYYLNDNYDISANCKPQNRKELFDIVCKYHNIKIAPVNSADAQSSFKLFALVDNIDDLIKAHHSLDSIVQESIFKNINY